MGWSPDQYWRATLPEVIGAIIGDNNRKIDDMRHTWESARFVAYVNWNLNADKRHKLRHEQELRRFPWEKKIAIKGEAAKVIKDVMKFRDVVKNKWKLKYKHE